MNPLVAAAATKSSTVDKLSQIPMDFWIRVGIAVVVVVVVVLALRKLAQVNKVLLAVIVFVGLSMVGFSWIYERNEPAWATPAVERLADFFPTKGKRPGY